MHQSSVRDWRQPHTSRFQTPRVRNTLTSVSVNRQYCFAEILALTPNLHARKAPNNYQGTNSLSYVHMIKIHNHASHTPSSNDLDTPAHHHFFVPSSGAKLTPPNIRDAHAAIITALSLNSARQM